MGLPLALGAAVGSERRVLALEADGSMMYTLQALWPWPARVSTSRSSDSPIELRRAELRTPTSGGHGRRFYEPTNARRSTNPTLDLCSLAKGLGVPSVRVTTAEELVVAFAVPTHARSMFIEAILPKGLS